MGRVGEGASRHRRVGELLHGHEPSLHRPPSVGQRASRAGEASTRAPQSAEASAVRARVLVLGGCKERELRAAGSHRRSAPADSTGLQRVHA